MTDTLVTRVVVTEALMAHAIHAHADYPQYAGYFDDWILVTVRENIPFKGSSVLYKDLPYLAAREERIELGCTATWRVYCPDTGSVVGCPPEKLKRLG